MPTHTAYPARPRRGPLRSPLAAAAHSPSAAIRRVVAQLASSLERVGQVHNFSKGMGLAAPQIGIGRAAAIVRTRDGETPTLLNPRITDESADRDDSTRAA